MRRMVRRWRVLRTSMSWWWWRRRRRRWWWWWAVAGRRRVWRVRRMRRVGRVGRVRRMRRMRRERMVSVGMVTTATMMGPAVMRKPGPVRLVVLFALSMLASRTMVFVSQGMVKRFLVA
jgi:hypothetical protein